MLAAGEIQVFNGAHGIGEREYLLFFQIVPLIQAGPVKTVLASHVAQRVDEEHQKGRARLGHIIVHGQPEMAGEASYRGHVCESRGPGQPGLWPATNCAP